MLVLLSFCGSVSDAPEDEDEKSAETAEAFALSIDGNEYSIFDYNDGYEKVTCTSFTLTAQTDVTVQEIFFSTSPLDTDTEITVSGGGETLTSKLVVAGSTAVRLPLDNAVTNKGNSFEIEFSAQIRVQSVLLEFEEI